MLLLLLLIVAGTCIFGAHAVGSRVKLCLRIVTQPTLGHLRLVKEWRGEPTNALALWARPGINRTAFDFVRHFDREALESLEDLLRDEDPPYLHGRGHRLCYEGAPNRFRKWLPIRVRAIRERELAQFGLDEMTESETP